MQPYDMTMSHCNLTELAVSITRFSTFIASLLVMHLELPTMKVESRGFSLFLNEEALSLATISKALFLSAFFRSFVTQCNKTRLQSEPEPLPKWLPSEWVRSEQFVVRCHRFMQDQTMTYRSTSLISERPLIRSVGLRSPYSTLNISVFDV